LKFDFEKWQSLHKWLAVRTFSFHPAQAVQPAWDQPSTCSGDHHLCGASGVLPAIRVSWFMVDDIAHNDRNSESRICLVSQSTPSVNSWWGPSHRGGLVRHEKELARACLEVDEMDRGSQPMFCDSLLHWFDTLRCQFSTSPLLHWFSDVSFQHLHCFIDSQMSVFNISIDVNVSNFKFTQHSEVSCDSVSSWCKLPPVALVQGTSSSMHSCQGKSPKCATWLRCADAHSQPSARCIARINLACSGCLANINIVLFCVSSQHPAWILISGMMNAMSSAMKQPAANPATQLNLLWSGSLKMWWRRSLRQRRAAKFNS
jgi:hypothetical protein